MTRDEAIKLFDYDAETGELRWRAPHRYAGRVAGSVDKNGYRKISIQRDFKQTTYYAHRLVWLWANGEWPPAEMDHVNMNRDDNRLANLRLAARSQNMCNRRKRRDSKSPYKGIMPSGRSGWQARIQVNGVVQYLGRFATPEEAHAAYCAALPTHGEYARRS